MLLICTLLSLVLKPLLSQTGERLTLPWLPAIPYPILITANEKRPLYNTPISWLSLHGVI